MNGDDTPELDVSEIDIEVGKKKGKSNVGGSVEDKQASCEHKNTAGLKQKKRGGCCKKGKITGKTVCLDCHKVLKVQD